MTITTLPIWFTDTAGAACMIVLSFLCIHHARQLSRRDPANIVWTYLSWVSYCLCGFAISRSVGHILKQMLLLSDNLGTWALISPYSGSVNTFLLIIVSAITLFFERVWQIYHRISADRAALQEAHARVLELNETLENRVAERTQALALSEKQIAQADKMASIGQLSSGIAHEINNPLGVILGYTQLLSRNEKPGSQKHEDLKVIEKNVKACKAIVEDLLNFARSAKPRRGNVDLNGLIDDVLVFIQRQSGLEAISIIKQYDRNMPAVTLDSEKIKQVLINLLMNAQHATGNKGTITVSTAWDTDNDRVRIRVRDDGYGIAKENLGRIFDPFFTTKPTGEGTGLGLSVSYGIIQSHGGQIEVASEPGLGTEFTITLPLTGEQVSK
ncbi:MAG: ATP-binding protein [Thermodesulfobacteriota bacterium]|nr:ATP-binding protein [Thermodesulfobacteriota bacterium]